MQHFQQKYNIHLLTLGSSLVSGGKAALIGGGSVSLVDPIGASGGALKEDPGN